MNYQDKNNLTFKKRRFNPYGAGEEYSGRNTTTIVSIDKLIYVEDGSLLKVEDHGLILKVN